MSAKWRVYNRHRNGYTHREKFRDDPIEIKAGAYILMDYEDAVQFKGQYFPMKMTPTGIQDPLSFKEIEICPDSEGSRSAPTDTTKRFVCQKDGREFTSQAELNAYSEAKYGDQIYVDEELEEKLKEDKADVPVKKKPGRPARTATA